MEAQDIFGLDFDPAELEKLAREGLPSDDEEEEEDDQYNVREALPLSHSLHLSLSLSLPSLPPSLSFSLPPSLPSSLPPPPFSLSLPPLPCDNELKQ